MSKIFEFENQFILRLPEELAEKVNKFIETPSLNSSKPEIKTMDLIPFIEKKEENGLSVENFGFKLFIHIKPFLCLNFKKFHL